MRLLVCRSNLQHSCDRLLDGVRKLTETEALVSSMKVDLARLQPVLEAKAAATAELLAKVGSHLFCCWRSIYQAGVSILSLPYGGTGCLHYAAGT